MNKKLITVLTLLMIFALSAPVGAQSFQDVPEGHWAHDALEQVARAGLMQGYGNGEFKGEESLSRYEVASLTANVLEKVENENEVLTEEVITALEALTNEFDQELVKLADELEGMNRVQITGTTGLEYNDISVGGDLVEVNDDGEEEVYADPYSDDDDMITAEDNFKQTVDTLVSINREGVTADLELETSANYFGSQDDDLNLKLDNITGRITTDTFTATLGNEQDLGWKDYFFGGEDNIDGVVLETGNSTVAFGRDEEDTESLAARQDGLFDLPVNVFMGIENEEDEDTNTVVGAEGMLQLAGVDITGEAAVNDTSLEGRMTKLGLSRDIDKLTLGVEYQNAQDFEPIQPDEDEYNDGEETTLMVEVSEDNPYRLYALDIFGSYEYSLNSEEEVRYVEAGREIGDVKLGAIYDFESAEDKEDKVVSVAYSPEFETAGIKLKPGVELAAIYDADNDQYLNQEVSLGAIYEINENLTALGDYSWANKEARVEREGQKLEANTGVEYKVTENSNASLSYKWMDFEGDEEGTSYDAQSLVGKYSLKF